MNKFLVILSVAVTKKARKATPVIILCSGLLATVSTEETKDCQSPKISLSQSKENKQRPVMAQFTKIEEVLFFPARPVLLRRFECLN
jgi:hypothetical protein